MAIRRTGSQTLVNRGVTAAAATPVNIITGSGGGGATVNISSIQIANSTFVAKDDLAIDTAGGYMIINGTGFQSGAVVYIQGTAATSTSFVSSSRLNVTVPALSSGLLDVYVVNTDGSGSIYLRSLNANGTPSWTTTSPLTTQDDGTAFAINLVASGAAGDGTITYAVSAGSTLPSGTFLASNGYFYGTVSGIEQETTYSFSVDAIDAQNQETARSFNITVRAGDLNLKSTVLLLNGETSNNTWITDSSTNNFAITVNGDTRPVAFSPYSYSNSFYFNGSNSSYNFNNSSNFAFGTGAFTIEFWINAPSNNDKFILGGRNASSFIISTGGYGGTAVDSLRYVGSSTFYTSVSICDNKWHHVAIVRDGSNNVNLYVDGISRASGTDTTNYSTTTGTWTVCRNDLGAGNYLNGYISNLRIIKGTALYTSTFTVPTQKLTSISGTSLLVFQDNRVIDNSGNSVILGVLEGVATETSYGPFTETDITTGSGYFDGTGDFLELTDSSNLLDIGGAVASIECWYYPTAQPAYGILISKGGGSATWNTSNGFEYQLSYTSGTFTVYHNTAGSAGSIQNTTTSPLNQWYHLVVATDASNNLSLFVNGIRVATTTNAITKPTTRTSVRIGNDVSASHPSGYITDMRVIVGTGAYSASASTITVPTNSLTPITNTRLLTLQSRIGENNNRIVDLSGLNTPISRNGNLTQGTFSPYQRGGWSNYFDGSGDYLSVPANSAFEILGGSFTIECWIYLTAAQRDAGIVSKFSGSVGYLLRLDTSIIRWYAGSATDRTYSFSTNTWYHIAVVSNGTTGTLYINGIAQGATFSTSATQNTGDTLQIGRTHTITNDFPGYISNLRILKGTALYTSNFTTPALPLTPIANTALLTCADNGFIDDSPNNFTITRNGDVSTQPFSPFKVHTYTPITNSVYFDGTGDYLQSTLPTALGTSDFTFEAWVYSTNTSGGGNESIFSVNGTSGFYVQFYTTIVRLWYAGLGSSFIQYDLTPAYPINRWYHVAATKTGSTIRLFLDGTLRATGTGSTNLTTTTALIGALSGGVSDLWKGYISNLRLIIGTSLYTSSFTPSTTPLTAVANTSLLTCQSSTIIDNSINNSAITVNGDTRVTVINPLGFTVANVSGPSADYSITNEGGSMYFDGNGDFLKLDTTNILTWSGTTTFTVEGWFYQTAFDATSGFMNNVIGDLTPNSSFGDALYWSIGMNNSNQPGIRWYGGPTTCNATEALTLYRWNHVAWVVSSGVLSIYINGKKSTLSGTSTITAAASSMSYVVVGADRGKYYSGYMSGLRVLKGTALYTSGFVPPAAPPLPIAGTTLLVNGTNGSIVDYTRKNNLETVGDVKIRNNIVKYGNTSMYFDGTGDYAYTRYSPDLDFGTGNFTVEFWMNPSDTNAAYKGIVGKPDLSVSRKGWALFQNAGTIRYFTDGTSESITTSSCLTAGSWTHIALVKNGSTTTIYANGTSVGTATNVGYTEALKGVAIGEMNTTVGWNNTFSYTGYIDDLRITKGVARYTSSFSAPNKHPTN